MLSTIYFIGLVVVTLWVAWVLFREKKAAAPLPKNWEWLGILTALLIWPITVAYAAILITWIAWDRRGY